MPETVSILSVRTVRRPVAPGVTSDQYAVTYAATGLTPRVVYVDVEKYSDDELRRVIAEDLRQARGAPAKTLEIP